MPNPNYLIDGLVEARKALHTGTSIRALSYQEVAALCGAKVELNGNSPEDFFYIAEQNKIANVLEKEKEDADFQKLLDEVTSVAGLNAGKVTFDESGNIIVKLDVSIIEVTP